MPPKKASSRSKPRRKAESEDYVDSSELQSKISIVEDEVFQKLQEKKDWIMKEMFEVERSELERTVKALKAITCEKEDMLLVDFIEAAVQESMKRAQTVSVKEEPLSPEARPRRTTRQTTQPPRESVPALQNPPPVQETILRAPGAGRGIGNSVITLQTPAGTEIRLPKMITPKIESSVGGVARSRVLRADEVAFSLAGSPVVVNTPPPVDMQELMVRPLEEMSPATRTLAVSVREFVHKKLTL